MPNHDEPSKQHVELVCRLIEEIGAAERHFNTIESEYRKLASTWLLAAFAGMGFLISADGAPGPVGVLIMAIALAASVGIQLLWVVDLLAYHRLLNAYFVEGERLETENPWLPPIRRAMRAGGTVGPRIRIFYLGCTLAPLPFGLGGYLLLQRRDPLADTAVLLAILMVAGVALALWTRQAGGEGPRGA